ncbi:MAG: cytochrome C oxidase subunit IV family protein [Candidatus Acidiferrales bacterium]
MSGHIVPVKNYVAVFIALLLLTGLTTKVAYIDLGHTAIGKAHAIDWNTVAALVIAVAKMLLVVLFFMHVKYSPGLTRLVIVAAFFWLAIMIALTLSDVLTRGWTGTPQPWTLLLPIFQPYC